MYNLKNELRVLEVVKKSSSSIFKGVIPGDQITLEYPISGASAGTTAKINVFINGVKKGENKTSQLKTNLLTMVCKPERARKGFENVEVKKERYDGIVLGLFARLKVVSIKKKTSAEGFRNLQVGDIFYLHKDVNFNGVAFIRMFSESGEELAFDSASRMKRYVENFELEELEWEEFNAGGNENECESGKEN